MAGKRINKNYRITRVGIDPEEDGMRTRIKTLDRLIMTAAIKKLNKKRSKKGLT